MIVHQRAENRSHVTVRPITVTYNPFGYAAGSVLLALGNTKVLCAVTLGTGVPPFLKGKKTGWLNAEYAMLPTATHQRVAREAIIQKRNGRSVEISRIISRTLRTCVNLDALGERTITIDCDVLQADGSTRTACITAASLALLAAQEHWLASGEIQMPVVHNQIAAVSVGITNNNVLVDLDYAEDNTIDADFTVVLNRAGDVIEFHGSTEKQAFSWQLLQQVIESARTAIGTVFESVVATNYDSARKKAAISESKKHKPATVENKQQKSAGGMFSLGNRLAQLKEVE